MGKAQSKLPRTAMKKALEYFEAHEIDDVMEIFQRLREDEQRQQEAEGKVKSTHAGIDIDTFGEYFSYPAFFASRFSTSSTRTKTASSIGKSLRGLVSLLYTSKRGQILSWFAPHTIPSPPLLTTFPSISFSPTTQMSGNVLPRKLDENSVLFQHVDLSGDGFIDKTELHKCLASTAFASFALLQAVAVEQGFMGDDDCLQPTEFEKETHHGRTPSRDQMLMMMGSFRLTSLSDGC